MATVTLIANTNYSALTVGSGDTIALAGFALTLDVGAPTASNVIVTAVGNAGTVLIGAPSTFALTGWTLRGGTAALVANNTVAGKTISGCTFVGSTTSGTSTINENAGVLVGCTIVPGTVSNANGIDVNTGLLVGCILTGPPTGLSGAVNTNRGTMRDCVITGGVTQFAVRNNIGTIVSVDPAATITDAAQRAIGVFGNSATMVLRSANLRGALPAGLSTLYRIGGATYGTGGSIAGTPTIVDLYDTQGTSYQRDAFGHLVDPLSAFGGQA